MKPTWKEYVLYGSIIIVVGILAVILIETVRTKNTGFETKTLWDWMELLIIPFVLAIGAFLLNRSERNNERQIATDRQQEAALQAYIDRMADLLLRDKLRNTRNKEVRNVARMRTLTALRGLDPWRKRLVILFLKESRLIGLDSIMDLHGADLSGVIFRHDDLVKVSLRGAILNDADLALANLTETDLSGADLRGADLLATNLTGADLRGVSLGGAYLRNADLSGANLRGVYLSGANLSGAKLRRADLRGAYLGGGSLSFNFHNYFTEYDPNIDDLNEYSVIDWNKAEIHSADRPGADLRFTDLRDANLCRACLHNANLTNALLSGANLREADLRGARVGRAKLPEAKSLQGAIMPDGTKHD